MAETPVRSWRTSFLTLRDETLTSTSPPSLHSLLQNLVFSPSDTLIHASPHLPSHEVTSDLMLLVELLKNAWEGENEADIYFHSCHLIHGVTCRVCLEINSSFWSIMLDFLGKVVQLCIDKAESKQVVLSGNAAKMKAFTEVIQILKYMDDRYGRKCSLLESTQLVKLLHHIVVCSHSELYSSPYLSASKQFHVAETGIKISKCENLWEVQTIAFVMIGGVLARLESSVSVEIWQMTVEVLRKVIDALVAKNVLVEDNLMSRFYTSLLQCLHLVLSTPKGSLSDHVAGFVTALRMFFVYGLTNRSPLVCTATIHKEFSSLNNTTRLVDSARTESGAYRPPHLRKRESRSTSDNEASVLGFTSSDSEHSDNDGSGNNKDYFRSSKARITAIICIQDLCQADPKSLTSHLTMLLPSSDVLHPRKYEATLLTCMLFDPVVKTRITSASTLITMLEGLSAVLLQVAEYKESAKRGSFTALSSSLGQILMQLHTGILYLVERENHSGLLTSAFKVLMLLVSATPYGRMPGDLLPSVISRVRMRIMKGFQSRIDGLMVPALGCLVAALSTSPPSLQVKEMLQEEISADGKQSMLSMTFQLAERVTNPTISFEAFQVLKAVSHNYPSIMTACWEQVSAIVYGLLKVATPDGSTRLLKKDVGNTIGSLTERCITAAIKVLDECLRATSGFKGTEDLLDDRSLDTPFTSDCTRVKRISSAPSYGQDATHFSEGNHLSDSPGVKQWCEAIEMHLPLILWHGSSMVRAASVTCFAGITSSIFFSLVEEKQEFILSSSIKMAMNDKVPSVRSAACRAIGVIACFPQISSRAETLDKFIRAAEINTHDPLVSVRITASWALANLCDSLRHRASDVHLEEYTLDLKTDSRWITLLADCALRLTKDGDKVKSNAVRALGNLSRFVRFTSLSNSQTSENVSTLASLGDPDWLGRMVQAFVSCVTTGNVKVQWNVCHALSNLFLNETIRLQDMAWAPSVFSILLLLLRDSSNFKIRIHAAAALAVPASMLDYGSSFSDVVQGLEHVLENLSSVQISIASSFKYRDALEKQLASTTLHMLGLASSTDHQPLKEFLVKKASFLEEWLKSLCSSLIETNNQPEEGSTSSEDRKDGQKKEMISKTIRSLIEVYERSNHQSISRRFEKLLDNLS